MQKNRRVPAIVLANIGTTMKGAVDRIGAIRSVLRRARVRQSYIHCDAALGGMLLPFMPGSPPFDFRAGIDSLAVSGHKFIGMPMPSGVVIALRKHIERVRTNIEYIGTLDSTLAGSRNGVTPLMLWLAIRRNGYDGFKRMVNACLHMTCYTI